MTTDSCYPASACIGTGTGTEGGRGGAGADEEAAPAAAQRKLRVFFIPVYASGHILPLCELAVLVARRHPGVEATMVVTPANAALVQPILDRSVAASSGCQEVKLLAYPFPSKEVGLPPGLENISSVLSQSDSWKVMSAVGPARDTLDPLLRLHRPDAVVADISFFWAADVAAELGIPHITFHAVGVFAQCVMNALFQHQQQQHGGDIINNDDEPMGEVVTVSDLKPDIIKIPMSELPGFLRDTKHPMREGWRSVNEMQRNKSYGVVANTFHQLEPAYCDLFRSAHCQRAWYVGPVSLANDSSSSSSNDDECLRWLDGRLDGSVVFICLGSWCSLGEEQMREMARGLESSGVPFLWAVRSSSSTEERDKWMPDPEWEERVTTRGRGMVARGWVPQVAILAHPALGAFLTHCGWNSTLEAAAAGVPVLTWPLAFEQFINERLLVDVVGAGERLSKGLRSEREEERVLVSAKAIAGSVSGFMARRKQQGDPVRERARRCGEMARAAVEEGGSSYKDLGGMIEELMELAAKKKISK